MKEKTQLLTPARKAKIQAENTRRVMLLSSLALMDYFGFKDDEVFKFWEKTSHYADLLNTPEAGIKMNYICELLRKNGIDVHWERLKERG